MNSQVSPQHPVRAPRAAVIVHGGKFADPRRMERLRRKTTAEFLRNGWRAPLWMPTTEWTRGRDEARRAVAARVEAVLVAGGDGTLRAVAEVLAETDVRLGVLPSGTGNLLARNLGVPIGDVVQAVATVTGGQVGRLDVGRLTLDGSEAFVFLAMAGVGFDAAMMSATGERAKRRWGHVAYVAAGLSEVSRRRSPMSVVVDAGREQEFLSHGLVVGNCGELTGGLKLFPGADPADGLLDAVAMTPGSLREWGRALLEAVRGDHTTRGLPRLTGRDIQLTSAVDLLVEADGDVVGRARSVRWEVVPGALRVCLPRPTEAAPRTPLVRVDDLRLAS